MAKFIKVKFPQLLLLLISFLFCFITACGNGESTTPVPSPSTSTNLTITATPSPTSVYSGQQSIVIATVLNADATPAAGQTVTFSFAGGATTGTSGATISAINSGLTNASGEAWGVYTGGSLNDSTEILDIVQATVSGTVALATITRTAGGAASGFRMTVVPSPNSVYSGQQSIVIATVLNADATPAAGQTVTFSFAGGATTGTSGATISAINSGLTNASGEAWGVYTGGSLNDSKDVIDIVQASVTGTVALTTITRSKVDYTSAGYSITSFGGIPATAPGTGDRFSDTGAANCQLKATVENDDPISPGIVGIPVTFTIFRGPGTLPAVTTISTDTNGEAWIFFDLPVPGAGTETIVRATVPLVAPQTNGGDAVSVIYW